MVAWLMLVVKLSVEFLFYLEIFLLRIALVVIADNHWVLRKIGGQRVERLVGLEGGWMVQTRRIDSIQISLGERS